MTNQEKKSYLEQCRKLNDRINQEIEQLYRLKSQALKITPSLSLMPKSPSSNHCLQSAAERIMLKEWEINYLTDFLIDLRRSLIDDIYASVTSHDLQLLLIQRYIYLRSWTETAGKLGINRNTVRGKKNRQALSAIKITEKTQYIVLGLDREHQMC